MRYLKNVGLHPLATIKAKLEPEQLTKLKNYVVKQLGHMDRYMRPLFNPMGKRILVIGSGWGSETYWALVNGAKYVCGVDPAERSTEPLKAALGDFDSALITCFDHRQMELAELESDCGPFDAVISNNVFEHIFDIEGTLRECRRFIPGRGGRIHIFADPLYQSSAGAHLAIAPWDHLISTDETLRSQVGNERHWTQYKEMLNGMTLTSFLNAVRGSGLMIEQLSIVPDRNRARFHEFAADIPQGYQPMDLLTEGVSCTLAFPHNL